MELIDRGQLPRLSRRKKRQPRRHRPPGMMARQRNIDLRHTPETIRSAISYRSFRQIRLIPIGPPIREDFPQRIEKIILAIAMHLIRADARLRIDPTASRSPLSHAKNR
ncbi:MAG: hypothetical protein GDA40_07710 [Rhodobacteraceae bacterium]|nr:hypothetical protein [Paracoccaceae bacterium]